ncbi:MAG: hypothetical protein GY765_29400 [bacterium]|nr:hypothetical protein [bacterium]
MDVLRLIIFCYNKILTTENFNLENIKKTSPLAVEDYFKYNLTKYLKKYKKKFPGSKGILFLPETGEYNKEESFTDIAAYNIDMETIIQSHDDFTEEDYYFAFECKRLERNAKNRLYIKEGIKRYVKNAYAKAMPLAGMIGFVEAGDLETIKNDINRRLETKTDRHKITTTRLLQFFKVEKAFKYSYSSRHTRIQNTAIDLNHLFLDYSTIIH